MRQPTSLRKRYFSMTLILGFLVIAFVLFFYVSTITTKQQVGSELSILQFKQARVNIISKNRLEIFRNIELFLLDPTIGYYDRITYELITKTLNTSEELLASLTREDSELNQSLESLNSLLNDLNKSVTELFDSRLDMNRQFPGLALAINEMTPLQQRANNLLQILIDEIISGELQPESEGLLGLMLRTNTLWVKQISQYQIYLSNRFASFSTDFLEIQASSINSLKQSFDQNMVQLVNLYQYEDSFEGLSNLQEIQQTVNDWHNVFSQVRLLHESDQWRTDNLILKQNIIPHLDQLSASLAIIEAVLQKRENRINSQIQKNTNTLFALIAVIIGLFLVFIITNLLSLDRMVFHPIQQVSNALKSKAFNREAPLFLKGGSSEITGLIEAFKEMDEKVNQRQNELEHQALHDYLTALPNRFMLNQRLQYLILTSERKQSKFALFFMDLDNFKDINDSLGHAIGDQLLLQVANRLLAQIRKSDTVARLGGDEFAILLPDMAQDNSERIAKNLSQSINQPFKIEDQRISIGMSIGIVQYPEHGLDATTLLQHADSAMYVAKRKRQSFAYYDKSVDFYSQNRLTLIQDLRSAIEKDSLMLYYQPQINCDSHAIFGAEALLRWDHPDFGFIQPDKIIELAEYSGCIHQLTTWVLARAVRDCRRWHEMNHRINISINISVQDLNNKQLSDQISTLLKQHQLDPGLLTIEVTESGMMENPALSIEILNKLKSMGINLSVDDFGTGFSSLKYLKQLPVDELKIDKSFIIDMEHDDNDRVIVHSTIDLGHNLGLEVIAEGIENESSLDIIKQYGCDRAQGYLFARPLTADEFDRYLEKQPAA